MTPHPAFVLGHQSHSVIQRVTKASSCSNFKQPPSLKEKQRVKKKLGFYGTCFGLMICEGIPFRAPNQILPTGYLCLVHISGGDEEYIFLRCYANILLCRQMAT